MALRYTFLEGKVHARRGIDLLCLCDGVKNMLGVLVSVTGIAILYLIQC